MNNTSREFAINTCNAFDCIHKDGAGCRKTTARIDNQGNCKDYEQKGKVVK